MSWKALITDKGNALSAKTMYGGGITLTKAKAGTGTVQESNLHSQTDILSVKQILSIENTYKKDDVANVEILLTCRGVETSYDLNQIGIYATDPDDGEILFAIAQSDEGKTIPAESEVPFYSIDFNFSFGLENDQSMVATIDQSTFATKEYVEVVNSRIDNIISQSGSTEGNTELIDIRFGADGETYQTAGEAIRKQFYNTNTDIEDLKDEVESTKERIDVIEQMADYVLEQSSYYTKWYSGKLECWGCKLNTTETIVAFAFPYDFTSVLSVVASGGAGGKRFPFYVEDITTNGFNMYVDRGSSTSAFHLRYYAVGKWK